MLDTIVSVITIGLLLFVPFIGRLMADPKSIRMGLGSDLAITLMSREKKETP